MSKNHYEYEKINCQVCSSSKLETITKIYSSSLKDFSTNVDICKCCGYSFLNPKPNKNSQNLVNKNWYNKKFSNKINTYNKGYNEKIRKRNEIMFKRLTDTKFNFSNKINILDFGSGYGGTLDFLKNKNINPNYFFIEQYIKAIDIIKKKGGTHIPEIEKIDKYQNFFDLVVMRHTLEHLDNLHKIFDILYGYLKKDGTLYLVVPNSQSSLIESLITDYFRPTHLSYFNEYSLKYLLNKKKFKIINNNKNGEIWIICRKDIKQITHDNTNDGKENFRKQKFFYKRIIKKEKLKSIFIIFKIFIKRLINI